MIFMRLGVKAGLEHSRGQITAEKGGGWMVMVMGTQV